MQEQCIVSWQRVQNQFLMSDFDEWSTFFPYSFVDHKGPSWCDLCTPTWDQQLWGTCMTKKVEPRNEASCLVLSWMHSHSLLLICNWKKKWTDICCVYHCWFLTTTKVNQHLLCGVSDHRLEPTVVWCFRSTPWLLLLGAGGRSVCPDTRLGSSDQSRVLLFAGLCVGTIVWTLPLCLFQYVPHSPLFICMCGWDGLPCPSYGQ